MKKNKNISGLFLSYLEGEYTEEDLKQLLNAFDTENPERELMEQVELELNNEREPDEEARQLADRVEHRLLQSIRKEVEPPEPQSGKMKRMWPWFSGAAAALLMVGFVWWNWFAVANPQIVKDNVYGYSNDVLPGGNKATLILSDGKSLQLDKNQTTVRESDGTVIAGKDGLLTYKESTGSEKALMNTLMVPKAGSYQLTLPDGSMVWINASSVLRFPTHFEAGERRVFLEGEAYFQVARNVKKPFRVQVGKMTVQALGTEFNINSGNDHQVKTTLTEGSVLVSAKGKSVKLIPGQEAVMNSSDQSILVRDADIERIIAWKDGYFYFKNDRFERIMDEVANWYGLKLHYKGTIPKELYTGSVDRNAKLSEVLEMLKSICKARFEIDRQELTIEFK